MSRTSSSQEKITKIGGEYGEIRANIDVDSLNKYFEKHVPVVTSPVEVKQFKVIFAWSPRFILSS